MKVEDAGLDGGEWLSVATSEEKSWAEKKNFWLISMVSFQKEANRML